MEVSAKESQAVSQRYLIITAVICLLLKGLTWIDGVGFYVGFIGGIVAAAGFGLGIIHRGNRAEQHGGSIGWLVVAQCEVAALVVALFVHRVAVPVCVMFSISVLALLKSQILS